ncbi:hypothetical protein GW17_00057655, partial [Ensete ventricosum]
MEKSRYERVARSGHSSHVILRTVRRSVGLAATAGVSFTPATYAPTETEDACSAMPSREGAGGVLREHAHGNEPEAVVVAALDRRGDRREHKYRSSSAPPWNRL